MTEKKYTEKEREPDENLIFGRNAVSELLRSGRTVDKILIQRGRREGSVTTITATAKSLGIPVIDAEKQKLDREFEAAKKKSSSKAKKSVGKAIIGAAVGAAITSVTNSIGNEVANSVTGKKTKGKTSAKDVAGKAVKSATTTAMRKLTRSILGNLIK